MSDNPSHDERIRDLTTNLMECREYGGFVEGYISVDDVTYLLRRAEGLAVRCEDANLRARRIEAQYQKLRDDLRKSLGRVAESERENAKLQRMIKTRENKITHLREQLSTNKLRRRLEKQSETVRGQGQRIEGLKRENERLRFQVEMDEALWRDLYEGASGLWGGGHVKPHALLNAERCKAALEELGPHGRNPKEGS